MSDNTVISEGSASGEAVVESTNEVIVNVDPAQVLNSTADNPPTTPPPAEDPKFASKFAALSRQEKQIREKAAEVEKRQSEIAAKQAEIAQLQQAEAAWQKQFEEDPVSALEAKGIKWDKVSERILTSETEEQKALKQLKQELSAMKDALVKEKEEAALAKQKQAEDEYNEKMRLFRNHLNETFTTGNYPLSREFASPAVVENLIAHVYSTTGKVIKNDEACQRVEEYFEQKLVGVLANETIKSKYLVPSTSDSAENASASEVNNDASKSGKGTSTGNVKGPSPTLGNKGTPVKPEKPVSEMDEDEKKAYFAQKLKVLKGKK